MTTHNRTAAPRVAASPGSMAAHTATRRSFLGGAAAVPVIITAGVAPAAAAEPDRAEWDRLCAAYHRAKTEYADLAVALDDKETEWAAAYRDHEPEPEKPDSGPFDPSKPFADYREPVEVQDSIGCDFVIQAADGPICFDRRPVGEDGATMPWQAG